MTNPKVRITDVDKSKGKSGKHNKFDPDNMIKKCKTVVVKILGNLCTKTH